MGAEATYPAAIGQLSVWRDLEKMPADRRWEANLPFTWDVPAGHTDDEIWAALTALVSRHESLRTAFFLHDDGQLRQRVAVYDPDVARASVCQGTIDAADREAVEFEQYRRDFDLGRELLMRAWIVTTDGTATHVFVLLHHIAADAAAALVLQDDFHDILAGASLPPTTTPRALALRQHGDGASRLRAAARYWHRTLDSAPRRDLGAPAPVRIAATLHTGIPLPMAHDSAAKLDISVATALLSAYYRGIQKAIGQNRALIYGVSNNRFDADVARMVTSLVQWAPTVLEFDAGDTFTEVAQKVHWKSFNALKYGACDPDAIFRIRDEFAAMDPPVDAGFNFNPMIAPPGFPSTDVLQPSTIEWYDPARATGPGVYLIVRALSSIEVMISANRPGFDKVAMHTCLTSIQDDLLGMIGLR